MAYITQAELEEYLGLAADTLDPEADLIADLIAQAKARIDTFCNRTFEASGDTTRYFDAVRDVCGSVLRLDKDLCQITTITNGDAVEVESDEYVTEDRNDAPWYAIRLLASSNKSWTYDTDPENAIAIVGRWAYSITVPDDVKRQAIRLVAFWYRQKDNQVDVERTVINAEGNMLLPTTMPADVRRALLDWKRYR